MPSISWKTFAFGAALVIAMSNGATAAIECSQIGIKYDDLFVDANKRVQEIVAEFKALGSGATDQQKTVVRLKFCAVGGELVGLYKFVRALANDCSSQGEKMGQLLDVINKQLGLAQQGVKEPCG
jgi:hypothetical protein